MSEIEQLFHNLEQRHISLRKEHEAVCIEREGAKGFEFLLLILIFIWIFYFILFYFTQKNSSIFLIYLFLLFFPHSISSILS